MKNRPAWREPMVWLMAGLPAASVVAGVLLLVTAVRSGGADDVDAPVQRRAQAQVTELAPDEAAQRLQLSAIVHRVPGGMEALPVSGPLPRDATVILTLVHPTQASQDRRVELRPTAMGWRSDGEVDASHDWLLRLQPADGAWRLVGRMSAGGATRLGPALGPD